MKDDNLLTLILILAGTMVASIIPYAQGFKSGYNRCLIDAVENQCATIFIINGEIKYEWKTIATQTAEVSK